jgi:hypothetical protein
LTAYRSTFAQLCFSFLLNGTIKREFLLLVNKNNAEDIGSNLKMQAVDD